MYPDPFAVHEEVSMSRYPSGGQEPRVQSTVSRRDPYDGGRERYRGRGGGRDRSRDRYDDRGDSRRRISRDDRDDEADGYIQLLNHIAACLWVLAAVNVGFLRAVLMGST